MVKDDSIYLKHILDAIQKLERYMLDVERERFLSGEEMVRDAVVRQLEIVGEAAGKLSKDLREKYSEIPWREIIGMRNKIIHEYFAVDYEQVWTTIERDIPQFRSQVKKILKEKN